MTQAGPHHAAILVATAWPLVLVLAELNFRLVETPLRAYGAQLAERVRTGKAVTGETLNQEAA